MAKCINTALIAWLAIVSITCASYFPEARAQAVKTISPEIAAALAAHSEASAAGAADANVTIIEFLDYNCPICKETAPHLNELLAADPKIRILYKEWPIFGPVSEYAARAALAASWQGKFPAAHAALIGAPHGLEDRSQVDSALQRAGLDPARLVADLKRHATEIDATITRNAQEARALGLHGTPGFVIGRQLESGGLSLSQLRQLCANARATR